MGMAFAYRDSLAGWDLWRFKTDLAYCDDTNRNSWDPWDSVKKMDRDGQKARNGASGSRSYKRLLKEGQTIRAKVDFASIARATPDTTDVVYFIQATTGGPVKIGHSTRKAASQRLKTIQTGHPEELTVVAMFAGGTWLERALHERFSAANVRGEWFDVTPEMLEMCPELTVGA